MVSGGKSFAEDAETSFGVVDAGDVWEVAPFPESCAGKEFDGGYVVCEDTAKECFDAEGGCVVYAVLQDDFSEAFVLVRFVYIYTHLCGGIVGGTIVVGL